MKKDAFFTKLYYVQTIFVLLMLSKRLLRLPTHVKDLRFKVFSYLTVKSSLQECYRKAIAQINS